MNQRFAASIAQTYVGWVDHAKWVEEIFIGTGRQRGAVGTRLRPNGERSRQRTIFFCPTDVAGWRAGFFNFAGWRCFHAGLTHPEKFAAGSPR